jgi:divalent metal cation (Fe/Co/Zn/Cd) transporter
MNFQYGHIHIIYLGLVIVSMLVGYSGFFILKKNMKFRQSDVMGIYGSILVILVAVIVFLYSLLHIFAQA